MQDVSLVRLYTLRACYLILAVGLGLYVWPAVLHHTPAFAATRGIPVSLLAGIGLAALLGLRYPVKRSPCYSSSSPGKPSTSWPSPCLYGSTTRSPP